MSNLPVYINSALGSWRWDTVPAEADTILKPAEADIILDLRLQRLI